MADLVTLTPRVVGKIISSHPELDGLMEEILAAVAHPNYRENDPHGGGRRERYFKRSVGAGEWLRVIVEFESPAEGAVVTAFPQAEDPT